jgi:hypothetical protein
LSTRKTLVEGHARTRNESGSSDSRAFSLTIFPAAVLRGQADVYSNSFPALSTGCSPITPGPLGRNKELFRNEEPFKKEGVLIAVMSQNMKIGSAAPINLPKSEHSELEWG